MLWRRAYWKRHIKIIGADVVVPTFHEVSSNLGIRNDSYSRASTGEVVVEFEGGEMTPATISVLPQKGSKFTSMLVPGANQAIVKWKRTDHKGEVSSLRLRVEGHWLEASRKILDIINDEIAKRPRM